MHKIGDSFDIVLVGGGVVGLSLAWELAQQGAKVCLIDSHELGHEASWAAAGMLPPGPPEDKWPSCSAFDQLAGLSEKLHRQWHTKLAEVTEIDNGYETRGAVYLGDPSLQEKCRIWDQWGVPFHRLPPPALTDIEPRIEHLGDGVFLPNEAQLHSRHHLQALESACLNEGVTLKPHCQVTGFDKSGNRISAALTNTSPICADNFCLTAGCWTEELGPSLGLNLPLKPVRGQILQLNGHAGILHRIVNKGPRYLMPRSDDCILVGSTQEEVGFNQQTTLEARKELLDFAHELCPTLRDFQVMNHWAGLRPATPDELPYLGQLLDWENAWIATGHFRAGIQLSTGTARVMRDLILGKSPQVDVTALGIERVQGQT
ncbi:glycine oxidase ThiO [Bythopirellula goksoeyrii]|uniref:Hydrogen cyanide synthase subunit HcnC n=1 Tax=Bythopirellula goksoeyrii TaxID=1400387 RepID=A0A5B9QFL9_9BACT|nr:glycine oxidase ThiO [Bythopirellula goksoeyrii]QEG35706.1 Hydrogen cyanide synthase subunit HcnC precursor [Bythopirellula goksoeyrii]